MGKKMLVRFNPRRPESRSSEFLAVLRNAHGTPALIGLKSKDEVQYGLIVYTGREVTPEDIFSKMVDAGVAIKSVDGVLADLSHYVDELRELKIGHIVELIISSDKGDASFKLARVIPDKDRSQSAKLP